jgi:Domain of unknown function (DUF4082)
VDSGPDDPVELGVRFRSDVPGRIIGIRFYKSAANTGTHIGTLWTSTGTVLATATFTGETNSGWQQVNFATPVPITANTVYVASYHCYSGHYSIDRNYFSPTSGEDNPPLHALPSTSSNGNGVFAYGANRVFPDETSYSSNYWVDVLFEEEGNYTGLDTGSSGGSQVTSIWPNTATPQNADSRPDNPVELGVKFRSDVAGTITGIRFYKSAANTGTHVGNLWTSSGTRLATAVFTNETASGWQQVNFPTPVSINANTVYVASYHCENGHYSADLNYFSNGHGQDNPPLHALSSNAANGNGVFAYGENSLFPNQLWYSCNYWVDVVFRE